jgi:adenosylcobinamide-GDP ribazoletransferase
MITRDSLDHYAADLRAAIGLLTRLPVPVGDNSPRGAGAAWSWPVAGGIVGATAGLVAATGVALGLSAGLCAALALGTQAVVTGAMHEDGLADTVDGFWGGWTTERRLAIMKDSHIGSYGVMALILVTLARWTALVTLISGGAGLALLVGVAALSRAPMAFVQFALPNARANGLSHSVGRPDRQTALFGLAIAILIALPGLGAAVVPAAIVVGLVTFAIALIARAKIGGQTGDVLGSVQQLSELAVLATLTALL